MEEQRVTFETARLAKTNGFNEQCNKYFNSDGKLNGYSFLTDLSEGSVFAPTQSFLQKWARDEQDTHIAVVVGNGFWNCNLYDAVTGTFITTAYNKGNHAFDCYEDALEQGLREVFYIMKEDELKSTLNHCLNNAMVGKDRITGTPNSNKIAGFINDWMIKNT